MNFVLFLTKIFMIATLFVTLLALIISKEKPDIKTPSEVAIYNKNGTFEILQFGRICYWYMSNFAEALSYFVKSLLKPSREVIESAEDVKICLEDFFGFFLVD
ncbi:24518_t:CDS:2, partial [Dentiscutata erythropus]